jgi:hypothetical protein
MTERESTLDERVDVVRVQGVQLIVDPERDDVKVWPTNPVTPEMAGIDLCDRLRPEGNQ